MNTVQKNLIENLRNLLARQNWDVKRLADMTGMSPSGIYKIIAGTSWPGPDNLERIARAFQIPVANLFGEPVATKKPTVFEAFRVLQEAVEAAHMLPDLSKVPRELLARLATADEDELSEIELVLDAESDGDGEFKSELVEAEPKKRKKR